MKFLHKYLPTKIVLSVHPPENIRSQNSISDILISELDVLRTVEKIKVNKSPGPDEIVPRILKETKHQISKPLSTLFNKSLTVGKVPSDWKNANVTPIFKKRGQIPARKLSTHKPDIRCRQVDGDNSS